jgi:hypothetical protein
MTSGTYIWYRNEVPIYVGKGSSKRARSHTLGRRKLTKLAQELLKDPNAFRLEWFPMSSEEQAFNAEEWLVEFFGREDLGTGSLYNLTTGGTGGSSLGPRAKQLIGDKSKAYWADPEWRSKVLAKRTARNADPEVRARKKAAQNRPEVKAKKAASQRRAIASLSAEERAVFGRPKK